MRFLVPHYTFDATAKTITFDDYLAIDKKAIFAIYNLTDGELIYSFDNPALGGSVATNVLTLIFDTGTMDDSDELQIFYERLPENRQTLQTAAAAIGTGVTMDVLNYDNVILNVRGITEAVITVEVTEDDTNWDPIMTARIGDFLLGTTISSDGLYMVSVAGMRRLRTRISTFVSGAITVIARAQTGKVDTVVGAFNPELPPGGDANLDIQWISEKAVVSNANTADFVYVPYSDVDIAAKPSAGNLFAIGANNKNAAERYIWVQDLATVPTGTSSIKLVYPIPLTTPGMIWVPRDVLGRAGIHCLTGISIGISTSPTTFTAATPADHFIGYSFK